VPWATVEAISRGTQLRPYKDLAVAGSFEERLVGNRRLRASAMHGCSQHLDLYLRLGVTVGTPAARTSSNATGGATTTTTTAAIGTCTTGRTWSNPDSLSNAATATAFVVHTPSMLRGGRPFQ
jgi:hypothetical protein